MRGAWESLEFFASPFSGRPQKIELYQPLVGFAWSVDGKNLAIRGGLRFGNQIYTLIINLVFGTLHQPVLSSDY